MRRSGCTHLHEPLVAPVPDEAALHVRVLAEDAPVLVQPAVRVAHRVRVLAEEERALLHMPYTCTGQLDAQV